MVDVARLLFALMISLASFMSVRRNVKFYGAMHLNYTNLINKAIIKWVGIIYGFIKNGL
jgi:hypothetical protein